MIYPLENIKNIGPKTLYQLKDNKIWSTYDLILRGPKRYENYILKDIRQTSNDEVITIKATVSSEIKNFKKNVLMTTFKVMIDKEIIEVVTFNKPFLQKSIKQGQVVLIKGKYNLYKKKMIASNVLTKLDLPTLKPIYGIGEIKDLRVYQIIDTIFKENKVDIYEVLPQELVTKYGFYKRLEAFKILHQPKNIEELNKAKNRFKYEEAFNQQKNWQEVLNSKPQKDPISYDIKKVKEYIKRIKYELTLDQKNAVNDIFRDLKDTVTHERLIQGDVGSGKTVVAFIGAIGAITANKQVAFMAPTEILAKQHCDNFKELFPEIKTVLLTSKTKDKSHVLESIKKKEISMIIGTHTLSSEKTEYNDLGLIIIDEQHKFGVKVKDDLKEKQIIADTVYLTATPIPRTMLIAYFGDLEVSIIKEKPLFRKKVKTLIINANKVSDLIKKNQEKDEQTFIVVPAITSDKKDFNIINIKEELSSIDSLYVLHGKQKKEEQEHMMELFSKDKKGVLLATSMIEVGIDVKNATQIFIMGANYFGLSQLHQLRGRVGRGNKESFCYLVSNDDVERLEVLVNETDGFKLSQYDLKTRGPGEFFSEKQTGYLKYNFLDLTTDLDILIQARKDVQKHL